MNIAPPLRRYWNKATPGLHLKKMMLALFLLSPWASSSQGQTHVPVLHAVVNLGGTEMASLEFLDERGLPIRRWIVEGESSHGWKVVEVLRRAQGVVLQYRRGESIVIPFAEARIHPYHPEGFDPEWINSDANPMLNRPILPTFPLLGKWVSMTEEEREVWITFFRNHGWEVEFIPPKKVTDGFRTIARPIFRNEREARLRQIHLDFEQMLEPEKLEVFQQIWNPFPGEGPIVPMGAQRTSEDHLLRYTEFVLSLSERQFRQYYRMRHDPNP